MDTVLLHEGYEGRFGEMFLNKCMYSGGRFHGLFLRLLFYFIFFIFSTWCTDHRASQLISEAWHFWGVDMFFCSVPDGSTLAGVPLMTVISTWSFLAQYVIPQVLCLFHFKLRSPCFSSNKLHELIFWWKRLKPTLNVLRSDSQILYCILKRQILNTIFF